MARNKKMDKQTMIAWAKSVLSGTPIVGNGLKRMANQLSPQDLDEALDVAADLICSKAPGEWSTDSLHSVYYSVRRELEGAQATLNRLSATKQHLESAMKELQRSSSAAESAAWTMGRLDEMLLGVEDVTRGITVLRVAHMLLVERDLVMRRESAKS